MTDQRLRLGTCAIVLLCACGSDPEAKAPAGAEMPAQMVADKPAGTADTSNKAASGTGGSAGASKAVASSSAGSSSATGGAGAAAPSSSSAGSAAAGSGGTAATMGTPEMAAAGAGGALASSGSDAADPSPGCSGGTLMPGESMKMMMSGGKSRVYVQHVPDKYDGKTPVPVVLDLHGGSYDGPRWVDASGFKKIGDTEGFITLFPSGTDNSWQATEASSSDGAFLKELIAEIGKQGCIDKKRIYATGCSMGGAMSFWMGCFASDLIAAIAPMCGTPFFALAECKPQRPFSIMLTIGETDNLNCWEGMPAGIGNPCAMTVYEHFKGLNMCTGESKDTHNGVCHTYDTCAAGTEVTACKSNTGHGVYQATNIEVTAESWKFLKRFHLP